MPTYEYKCSACDHVFEKFQSITAAPIKKCPQCGKNKAKRLLGTGAGLIFKGSGFYITDYRSESYKNAAKSDSGAPASSDGKSATGDGKAAAGEKKSEAAPAKTESKPAAPKSESKPAAKKK
jgi:putative FmdB family regulatory protein